MSLARYLSDDKPINNQSYVPHFRQHFLLQLKSLVFRRISLLPVILVSPLLRENSEVVYYIHASVAVLMFMLQHVLVDTLQLCVMHVMFCVTAKFQLQFLLRLLS